MRIRFAISCVIAVLCGFAMTVAAAGTRVQPASPQAQYDAAAFARRLQQEETRLRAERAAYPAYFRHAYAAYPRIPRGTLEAITFVQSRWHNLAPPRDGDAGHLTDAAQWSAWVGNADGAITAASVTLDAIWLYRAQTSYDVNVYVDEVQISATDAAHRRRGRRGRRVRGPDRRSPGGSRGFRACRRSTRKWVAGHCKD